MNWNDIATVSVTLFFIMDPLGNVPVFNAVLANFSKKQRMQIVARELCIALAILFLFLFSGNAILSFLGLSQSSLNIAGGILLFIIALRMIFPKPLGDVELEDGEDPFLVPLAIPMIAGPSTIAVLLLLSSGEPDRMVEWSARTDPRLAGHNRVARRIAVLDDGARDPRIACAGTADGHDPDHSRHSDAAERYTRFCEQPVALVMAVIRQSSAQDVEPVLELYLTVAGAPGGLARLQSEIDHGHVRQFMDRAIENGVSLVAVSDNDDIVGEIHAVSPGIFCFSHVLTDLTIAVHPNAQAQGIGRRLFQAFMHEVQEQRPEISRVELVARESNVRALGFYESLGFVREGVFERRIANVDGSVEADIPMAWLRDGGMRES